MLCFKCKLVLKKKKKASKPTRPAPVPFLSRITLDQSSKSLNEIHVSLVWQLTVDCNSHFQAASHRIKALKA